MDTAKSAITNFFNNVYSITLSKADGAYIVYAVTGIGKIRGSSSSYMKCNISIKELSRHEVNGQYIFNLANNKWTIYWRKK